MIDISKKYILIICIIGIIIVGLVYYFTIPKNEISLSIDVLDTTDFIDADGNYFIKNNFSRSDTIYVFQDFSNFVVIENETKCDLYFKLTITYLKDNSIKKIYHTNITYYYNPFTEAVLEYMPWIIPTDETWDIGEYNVNAYILDRFSDQSVSKSTYFSLEL